MRVAVDGDPLDVALAHGLASVQLALAAGAVELAARLADSVAALTDELRARRAPLTGRSRR